VRPLSLAALLLVSGLTAATPVAASAAADSLAAGFASPPADARPLVWWHWVNGNISRAGIEADLADMKRVGIAGAQMFDVSIYLPPGPVRYGTETWHEHVQHAIRTAARHGLEFHAMNTPGWSASGGPWVTPERSMKKLVWSETTATGGGAVSLALPPPAIPPLKFRTPPRQPQQNFFRDVAVLAVPADASRRTPDWQKKTKLEEKSLVALPPDPDPAGCIPRAQVLDLTAQFDAAAGTLAATLPPGRWTILRFGFTSTGSSNHPAAPEGHGLEIDKLDADAVAWYFDQALGRILRDAGPLAGRTFKALLFDSFEGGPQNWTDTFPAQFAALRGYELRPLLPVLTGRVIESAGFTEAVLRDFRGAVEELMARNYFGTMRRRAHEHGLLTYAEAQGGPLNPVACAEHVDVPMNEFWMPEATPRLPRIRLIASAANVLGRPLVAAEAFTATPENGRWQNIPSRLKVAGDTAWTAGINRFILHHYTHQPTDDGPGFGLGRYGTNFGRLNSWWPLARGWVDYVARGQFLLQQGRTVADVAFLLNEDYGYAYPASLAVPTPGHDADIVHPRHLAALEWREGALRLATGPAYRLLVLPDKWAADRATLRRLRELARAGAPIIGPAPVAPAGAQDFADLPGYGALVGELWGGGGQAALVRAVHRDAARALRELGVAPDFRWVPLASGDATASATRPQGDGTSESAAADGAWPRVRLRHLHRRTSDADVYFVFNHADAPATGELVFRVAGRQPEIWDAVTGRRWDAPVFQAGTATTTLPIDLEPHGSRFVVFRRPLPARWIEATTPRAEDNAGRLRVPPGGALELRFNDGGRARRPAIAIPAPVGVAGPWRVEFEPGKGAPAVAEFARLASWTEQADPGIRFFSGVATYRTRFTLEAPPAAGAVARLDLGAVADLAEVTLNGVPLGILWHPPFRVDATTALRPGENVLEVRVANRWINRLIGDEAIPADLRYQNTGKQKFTDGRLEALPPWLYDRARSGEKRRVSFATWKHYAADSPLVPAGLLGPVRVEWLAVVEP
jgi:hypothetical protein